MRMTLLAVLTLCAVAAWTAPVTLVKEGVPMGYLLLAAEPTRAAQMAAFELQAHIKLITGAEMPIVREGGALPGGPRILVGESLETRKLNLTSARFANQEYLVRILADTVILIGKDRADYGTVDYDRSHWSTCFITWPDIFHEQGTLYAAYDFLERYCGVRWLNPTETGTFIPRKATLAVEGKEIRRTPFMRFRYAYDARMAEGYDPSTALWRGDTPQYQEWEASAYPALHRQFPDAWQYQHAKRAQLHLFLLRRRNGGEKCFANHSMYHYYDRYWQKTPGLEAMFEENRPEYFAKGYPEGTEPPQLCYTNPGLVTQLVQDARNYFDKGGYPNPSGRGVWPGYQWGENYFCVEPMDNSAFCKCPECSKLTALTGNHREGVFSVSNDSNYMFSFVNKISHEVKKTHPDKRISTLAYGSHAWPPTAFKLDPDIVVHFCFAANRMPWDRRGYANDLAALKAWRAEDPDRPLYLWLYDTFPVEVANNGKWNCFPGFFAHTVDKQMKLFKENNIQGIFHCGYGQDVEAYVTFRMMDDPSLKIDDVLNDYFTGLYGAAAKPMRAMYEAMEETYTNPNNYPADIRDGKRSSHQTVQIAWEYLGTPARMAKFQQLLDQAKAIQVGDRERQNIDLFEKSTWSYMVAGQETYARRMAAPIPNVTAPRVPDAGGDPAKVEWARAAALPGSWYDRGQDKAAARKFSGRIAHDGTHLYLELTDPCDTTKLVASSGVFCYDDWEVFIGKQRALPYRQFACGPTGLVVAISHGEVNWRMNVPIDNPGIKAIPTVTPDTWVTCMVLPLATAVQGGVQPGGKLYMNILRVSSPGLAVAGGPYSIDTWVSYCTVHEVDRLAEITLQK